MIKDTKINLMQYDYDLSYSVLTKINRNISNYKED